MRIACLLLAAGAGSRFGGRKQLASFNGKPLVLHALEQLQPLFGPDLYCVIGAHADEVAPVVAGTAHVIEHPGWERGLGSSIARGMGTVVQAGYGGVLIALADQALLRQEDYRRLLDRFDGRQILASGYAGRAAVPALFPAAFFADLQRLDGDSGARELLRDNTQYLRVLPLPRAESDIDTPLDLIEAGRVSSARFEQPLSRPHSVKSRSPN